MKVLKCAQCVKRVPEDNYDCGADEVRVSVCVSVYTSRSESHSPIVSSKKIKKKTIPRHLTCIAATGRPGLVFFLVLKTSAGTSDEEGYGDCRHILTTKNPTKTLMNVTMSMKTTMTTVQHRVLRLVWSCFPFPTVQFVCIRVVLRS